MQQRHDRRDQLGVDVEERQHHAEHVAADDRQRLAEHARRVGDEVAVAEHRALRAGPSCPRCRRATSGRRARRRPRRRRRRAPRSGAERVAGGLVAATSSRSARQLVAVRPRSPAAAAAVQTIVLALESSRMPTASRGGQVRVDRVEDGAEPEDRPPDLEVVGPVAQHDADHVAAAPRPPRAGRRRPRSPGGGTRRRSSATRASRTKRSSPISAARVRSSSGRVWESVLSTPAMAPSVARGRALAEAAGAGRCAVSKSAAGGGVSGR